MHKQATAVKIFDTAENKYFTVHIVTKRVNLW